VSTSRKKKPGTVWFVGVGPGDPQLLTFRAGQALARADTVVVDAPWQRRLLSGCRPDVQVLDAPAGAGDTRSTQSAAAKLVVATAREQRRVVRLVTGDPLLFGAGGAEAEACARAGVPFEIVPGVPAALAVPSYAGIPLTTRRVHDVRVVDIGREVGEPDWRSLAATSSTLVLLGVAAIGKLVAALLEHGCPGDTPVAVTTDGTTTAQRTVVSTLDALETDVAGAGLHPPVVMVVGEVVKLRERLSWFETKPLFGWRVLVPRTKEQAGALSEQLLSYGAIPVEVPTIAVEPPRTPAPLDRAIKGLVSGRYQWVAFTSVNAVRAVREKLEELGLDSRALAGVRAAAIGEATAAALEGWGIRPDLRPTGQQSSEGLLESWPAYDELLDPLDRVFLPRADIATETLVAGLRERGWSVDDVTAYRTVRAAPPPAETREAIKTGGFDAVLFTSSSTVRNLVGIAGKPHSSSVIAVIGPQTARTAEELGLRVDVVAPTPSAEALAEALADYGRERRLTSDELPGKANRRPPVKTKKPR
jgi:uroporphyrinogen III methyltransferase/synthase